MYESGLISKQSVPTGNRECSVLDTLIDILLKINEEYQLVANRVFNLSERLEATTESMDKICGIESTRLVNTGVLYKLEDAIQHYQRMVLDMSSNVYKLERLV